MAIKKITFLTGHTTGGQTVSGTSTNSRRWRAMRALRWCFSVFPAPTTATSCIRNCSTKNQLSLTMRGISNKTKVIALRNALALHISVFEDSHKIDFPKHIKHCEGDSFLPTFYKAYSDKKASSITRYG